MSKQGQTYCPKNKTTNKHTYETHPQDPPPGHRCRRPDLPGHPDLVGRSGLWGFCQQIGSNWVIVVAVGGLDSVAVLLASTDALALYKTSNPVASMSMPKIMEFVDNSGRTVGLAAFGVDDRDLLNQCLIRQGTGPWTLTSPIPVIEPAG